MKFLLDTHLLLWSAVTPARVSGNARALIEDRTHTLFFSVASMWETAIKHALGRAEFRVDPNLLRGKLLRGGYQEIPITSDHSIVAGGLPLLHRDPFDRMLVAQAKVEGIVLLTADAVLAAYGESVRRV